MFVVSKLRSQVTNVYLKIIFALVAFLVGVGFISAWTAPAAMPPQQNVPAPIHTGASYQQKGGDLGALRMRANQYCDINGQNCVGTFANQTVSCPSGQAIRSIGADGTVACVAVGGNSGGSTIRRVCSGTGCPGGCNVLSVGGSCSSNQDWLMCSC